MNDEELLGHALAQAREGSREGGIPIGAALAHDGALLGAGRNRRVQQGSATRHGETDCLENVGRLPASIYAGGPRSRPRSHRATCVPVRSCCTRSRGS